MGSESQTGGNARDREKARRSPRLYSYLTAFALTLLATAIFLPGREYFAKGQWALLYLLVIALVANISGVKPAMFAAVLSFLAWNYFFLPPFHTFTVTDPKDLLALGVFLIVATTIGLQTGRLMEREQEAGAREREMALLNRFGTHLVSETSLLEMANLLFREITEITSAADVIIYLPDGAGGLRAISSSRETPQQEKAEESKNASEMSLWVYRNGKAIGLPKVKDWSILGVGDFPISVTPEEVIGDSGWKGIVLPLQTATRQVGVLYIAGREDGASFSIHDARLLVALAYLASAFIERKHLQSVEVQAESLKEADRLKSIFISSVSHELKTPLASVTATISNIAEEDIDWDKTRILEEIRAVQEDINRLNGSIGSLIDLSRLEASIWEPKMECYEIGEILAEVISIFPNPSKNRITFSLPDDMPPIKVDFRQWARAVQNILENALIYSPSGSPVWMGASHDSREIRIWVEDRGSGVPAGEKKAVFEKFYRGSASKAVPSSTGLGLAITYEIVRYHGGQIWVEDAEPRGARFVISLPREN